MASKASTTASSFFDDPLSLVCKLCDKIYQHKDGPLMLPCLHSFCKPCLAQYIKKEESNNKESNDKKKPCPTCSKRFVSNNQFPVNLRLSHLAKTAVQEERAEAGNVKCDKCTGTPADAVYFFCNRSKFLCEKCKIDYDRFLDDENQEFIELASYTKGNFKVHSEPAKCQRHGEKLILYCDFCKILICMACAQTRAHKHHDMSSIDETAAQERTELQQILSDGIVDALSTMDQTLQQIQNMRDKVKVSAEEATKRINKMCDDLIQAVENRRNVLTRKCREIAEGKDDVLSNQTVEVERLRKDLGYAQAHAQDAVDNHSFEEILSVKKAIKAQLNQTMEIYRKQSMELREDDSLNTTVEIEPAFKEIQTAGFFPDVPDHSKCLTNGLVSLLAGVGKLKEAVVYLKDEKDKLVEGKCCFQYQLRKVGEDPDEYIPPKVTITQNNDGSATLGFTPDQPGEYELTIMVRNKPIADPYKITAKNFMNMQPIFRNVDGQCFGVAVHDNGTVYASNYDDHTIKVFKPDGTNSKIGSSKKKGGPKGLALIGDTLCVVYSDSHVVKMYSTDGKVIREFGGEGTGKSQLSNPCGICTGGSGRIFVADFSNKRIQIFSSEGVFSNSISCSCSPYDVAVDKKGNIHVAAHETNHIVVYSKDGEKFDTYSLGGKLQYPTGIFIDGEGNRLISAGDNLVCIADPAGTLIASKEVNGSWGVAMDKNYGIYVTEKKMNRVCIYY